MPPFFQSLQFVHRKNRAICILWRLIFTDDFIIVFSRFNIIVFFATALFGSAFWGKLPQEYFTIARRVCQGCLQKGNLFPLFERKPPRPPPPRAVHGEESAFTYTVVFLRKNSRFFENFFDFFKKISAPPALRKAETPFTYTVVFLRFFGFLENQIALIRPKILVCLGRIAAKRLIEPEYRITKQHGQWIEKEGIWMTAIYHPSALLRDLSKRPETFRDLLSIRDKIRELGIEL